ncbi:MAG: hypothetical protein ACI82F_001979 [Planctomycetota bacterium]|jgi:hypothetical protein
MKPNTRRVFLQGLSGSLLAVGLGSVPDGRCSALIYGEDDGDELDFGELEPLVALMQETAPDRLQEILVAKLHEGMELRTLVAAGALANARTFGGHDYTGYHCMMALVPAYGMAQRLPEAKKPLPVLKVLYRTASRIQEMGGRSKEALHQLPAREELSRDEGVRRLRKALIDCDVDAAEGAFASLSAGRPEEAFDDLQSILHENMNVHRVVLAWRSWETLSLTGSQHAHTLLRQSVRFCIDEEDHRVKSGREEPALRALLPELIDRHELEAKQPGGRTASDEEVLELSRVIFRSDRPDAAKAMAEAMAGGLSLHDAGEAISLAANQLMFHDPGRKNADSPEKPKGSVHGASFGVHAADAARAWRNIAGVSNHRNAIAGLITGAFHTAGQSQYVDDRPVSFGAQLEEVQIEDSAELLRRTRTAIEEGDQMLACAAAQRWGDLRLPEGPLFDLLLEFGVSQDGALHAEKYYHTICEEYAVGRPAFRTRHLVALARVSASEHGWGAPGLDAARRLIGV